MARHYQTVTVPLPSGLKLEASGLAALPDGRLAIAIRKGEVWIADGVESKTLTDKNVRFTRFASGLHEPLGLTLHDGDLYTTQRSEVTHLRDTDGDGVVDEYLTAGTGWGVSGNYHEYAYGPVFDHAGRMWVTLNTTIGKPLVDDVAWRGWSMVQDKPGGDMRPVSAGLRSPIGIGVNHEGDVFATDHQGNWFPTCPLLHLKPGAFHGHADALKSSKLAGATVTGIGKLPEGKTVGEVAQLVSQYQLPAVWFPYGKMGQGTTGIVCDETGGKFGPFEHQFFVGEFTLSRVSRVWLEKVGGEYQGACFPFLAGFDSAVVSLEFGRDGSLFVGETNRGWNSVGVRSFGLQRVRFTGKTPFEIQSMSATSDGFVLTFTEPVDTKTAGDPAAYRMSSYTYRYSPAYGGDETNTRRLTISAARVLDERRVRLTVDGLRATYVHELHAEGVRAADGRTLLHAEAYYTLNRIPSE
ncbi:MAG: hypothetical protein GC159_06825 [Phycisphaera sp.]|nr:hypothetical protein [Phycisphaera sp.]